MKKYILTTALISAALFAGCKKEGTVAAPASGTPAAATTAAAPAAKFSDSAVNDFVKTYSAYADDYVAALAAAKKGDTSKMLSLSSKAQEMATLQQQLVSKLKPEEAAAFADAMNKISQRIQEAAAK